MKTAHPSDQKKPRDPTLNLAALVLDEGRRRSYELRESTAWMFLAARRIVALGALCLGTALACSTSDPSTSADGAAAQAGPLFCELPPSCHAITQACMPKDDGTPGPIHDCHTTGMVKGVEAVCRQDLAKCVSLCSAAPGFNDGPIQDVFAACKDGGVADAGPLVFPSEPLSTFTSDGKDLRIELRTAPEQPIVTGPVGEAELTISNVSDGSPADGLDIAVATWMPVMGHPCSPVTIKVEPKGNGVYLLSPFLVSMPGACEVKLTFSGEKSEHAVSPTFEIPR